MARGQEWEGDLYHYNFLSLLNFNPVNGLLLQKQINNCNIGEIVKDYETGKKRSVCSPASFPIGLPAPLEGFELFHIP